jgi:hypothetical protein
MEEFSEQFRYQTKVIKIICIAVVVAIFIMASCNIIAGPMCA